MLIALAVAAAVMMPPHTPQVPLPLRAVESVRIAPGAAAEVRVSVPAVTVPGRLWLVVAERGWLLAGVLVGQALLLSEPGSELQEGEDARVELVLEVRNLGARPRWIRAGQVVGRATLVDALPAPGCPVLEDGPDC